MPARSRISRTPFSLDRLGRHPRRSSGVPRQGSSAGLRSRGTRWQRSFVGAAVALAVGVASLVTSAGSAAGAPAGGIAQTTSVPGIELTGSEQLSARLHELQFESAAADGGSTQVRVLLPEGYDPSGATRYPVLYLLHGGGGGADSWTVEGDAEALTAGFPLIVVMPGVTGHGNYVDWYNGGAGGAPMWETFMIGQLLPWVDANLPTVGQRSGRAVAGLSMGGGGATGYAALHPDLFVATAAFSGAVDTNTPVVQLVAGTTGYDHGHAPFAVYGDRVTQEVRWRGHNPWDLAANLRDLELIFLTTGNGLPGGPGGDLGDPVEYEVHEMMTNLHDRLVALGIDHHWDDYGPGGHSWWYWNRALSQLLPRLMDSFAAPSPAPKSFSFTTIEPAFSVWGWDVSIQRPVLEFATLRDAGSAGFTVAGSGRFTVVTPPDYAPGQPYSVTVSGAMGPTSEAGAVAAAAASGTTETVIADDAGRLHLEVAPGPGNPHQQFTVEGRTWALTQPAGMWPVHEATVTIRAAAVATPVAPSPSPAAPPSGPSRLPATGTALPLPTALLAALAALALLRLAQPR